MNGEAVCRHIAQMLKDIYLDYGITSYDISVFQKDTTTDKSMLSYYQKELQKVNMLIEGAVAAANQCDLVTSKSRYQKAESLLKQIKCY